MQDAAKAIGVSKKSLDDYYYQLRLGEFYDFDFSTYRDEKIGFLRSFVRGFNEQKESKRNRRHPRKLKIIESDS